MLRDLKRLHQRAFSDGPQFIFADALVGAIRKLDLDVLESEVLVDRQDQIVHRETFIRDLLLRDEHMRVVLRKAAHAHQAMHRAGRLKTMHLPELGDLQGQFAIRLQPVLEDLDMAGAVHRLDGVNAVIVLALRRHEHVFGVGRDVARRHPQLLVHQLRRVDFLIAGFGLPAADVVLQHLEQRPALVMPEHRARRFFLEMKQVHLASETPMVALLGFLDLFQVSVEVFLLGERGAVDARQHRVVAVAAPICARNLH